MGRRGPLPKPTKLKQLEGNPGRRKLPQNEPQPRILPEVPPPPKYLPTVAAAAWRFISQELHAVGLLTSVDEHALEQYCVAYDFWRQCLEKVSQAESLVETFYTPTGEKRYAAPLVEVSLMLKYGGEINRWAKVLGLGPAYRVALTAGNDDEPIDDPLGAKLEKG
jgi:P27 family predicted phage terminase small subunit